MLKFKARPNDIVYFWEQEISCIYWCFDNKKDVKLMGKSFEHETCLNETVLLSTHNLCLDEKQRK